ncbi:hypothetical protein MAXJ12_19718 [Mesorhizobium alhagi CCNWXJ12-2]|uniref:Uncharacterized protein n=1 Tax=Mesorhizobium alhagi CCNWXJ12-2 TaxID=1107882 RepID=H0HUU3_9HYPH|nr:hypothetical protein MAXJ12_19718 [Mesorhizobium alhagi CCNWXJ12-2]
MIPPLLEGQLGYVKNSLTHAFGVVGPLAHGLSRFGHDVLLHGKIAH